MTVDAMQTGRPTRASLERDGHCGTKGCRCTHRGHDPYFPEAPACEYGFIPAPPGALTRGGNPVGPDAVVPCPRCRLAAERLAAGIN